MKDESHACHFKTSTFVVRLITFYKLEALGSYMNFTVFIMNTAH